MKGYLLDTNVVLLGMSSPERLSSKIRTAVHSGPNFISVISFWEVVLKSRKGKLDVADPRVWWKTALDDFAATMIPLRAEHIAGLCILPPIHQDPFDRVLIAQAISEELVLATTDGAISGYKSGTFGMIR